MHGGSPPCALPRIGLMPLAAAVLTPAAAVLTPTAAVLTPATVTAVAAIRAVPDATGQAEDDNE